MRRAVLVLLLLFVASSARATDLKLRKVASTPTVTVGDPFFFTFEIDNRSTFGGGPFSSPNTVLTDELPPEFRFVSAAPDQGSCSFENQILTCNLGTVPANDVVNVILNVDPIAPGIVTNEGRVFGDLFDPDPSNNEASSTVEIEERPSVSDLSVMKTASRENADVGGSVIYTITVSNAGPDDATNVLVSDALPAEVQFQSATEGCHHDVGVVTCEADLIPEGESVTFTIITTVLAEGEFANTATVDHESDPNDENNASSVTVSSTTEQADISLTKSARRLAYVGRELVYTIRVTNNGPDDATGVNVTDALPTAPDGSQAFDVLNVDPLSECSNANGTISCNFPDLPRGATKEITITVNPLVRATLVNTASVTAAGPSDPDASNNTRSAETYITRHGATTANMPLSEDAADPVNTASGEFYLQEEADLFLGGPLPLFFARYYGSRLSADERISAGLGPDWSHNFAWHIVRYDDDVVEAVTPTGGILPFELREGDWVYQGRAVTPYQLREDGTNYLLANPRSGMTYRFNQTGHLLEIDDRNGNTLDLTYQNDLLRSASDGLGRELTFTHSGDRITSVTDGTRTVGFSYTSGGRLMRMEDVLGRATVYEYGSGGQLEEVARPGGMTAVSHEIDAEGRVESQTDWYGGTTTFDYGPGRTTFTNTEGASVSHSYEDGRLVEMTDAGGEAVRLEYDSEGRRSGIEDRAGSSTTIEYHEPSGFASVVRREGGTVRADYISRNANGFVFYDVESITQEDGSMLTYEYDANGNTTAFTDAAGRRTEAEYNARGQATSITSPGGATTSMTYRPDGLLATIVWDDGRRVTFGYDDPGRPNIITYPGGSTRQFEYDAADRVTAYTNARGMRFTYAFDAAGNIARITDPEGASVQLEYNDAGLLMSLTDREGNTSSITYDQLGRPSLIANPLSETMRLQYDTRGRLTGLVDARGQTWSLTYDDEGLLTATSNPLGQRIDISRDANGNVVEVGRPDGTSVSISRDARGRITATTDAAGRTVGYSYDASGLLAGVTLPGGSQARYERDSGGELTAATTPGGGTWNLGLDELSRIIRETDPLGRATTLTYDANGRVARINYPGSAGSVSFIYDEQGNILREDYSDETSITYQYDSDGRLISSNEIQIERDENGSVVSANGIRIDRDEVRRIARSHLPAGAVDYRYDGTGNVIEVEDWQGGVTSLTYDAAGRRTAISRPNGVRSQFDYDAMGRLTSETTTDENGTVLWSLRLERDNAGRIASASLSPALAPRPAPTTRVAAFNEASANEAFSYDDLGRRREDSERAYQWKAASRLASYSSDEGTVSFTYDGLGRRISRTDERGTRTYTWNDAFDPAVVSVETHPGGGRVNYVHLPNGEPLFFADDSGGRYFYHFDHTGSTRFLTDDAGGIAAAYAYGPYGEPAGSMGEVDNPFTFHGSLGVMHESDALYYMRARYYDAASAQFISRDPLQALDPAHLNPYQFVLGNPVSFGDPTGLDEQPIDVETPSTLIQVFSGGTNLILDLGLSYEAGMAIEAVGNDRRELLRVLARNAEAAAEVGKLKTVFDVVGGVLTFGVETYQSGNVLRGGGALITDVAIGSNPITAGVSIASDVVDLSLGFFGVTPVKLKEPVTNGGRLLGAAATDLVATTGVLGENRKSSLQQLAEDIDKQDGVIPKFLSETGETLSTGFGFDNLFGDHNIESIRLDYEAERLKREKVQESITKFLQGN